MILHHLPLNTKRLCLRPFHLDDLDDFYAYASVEGVGEMAGWLHHKNKKESQAILEAFIQSQKELAIVLGGKVIGSIGVYPSTTYGEHGANIGFVLSQAHHRQGYMQEALTSLFDVLFQIEKVNYIDSSYYTFNEASQALHKKMGFVPVSQAHRPHRDGKQYLNEQVLLPNPGYIKHIQSNVQAKLKQQGTAKRAMFDHKLNPTLEPECFLGNTMPTLRQMAKQMTALERVSFMLSVPHTYFDETILHALCINTFKNEPVFLNHIHRFVPLVNSWAACDSLNFKTCKDNQLLWQSMQSLRTIDAEFPQRIYVLSLFNFIDTPFLDVALLILSTLNTNYYYVHMAVAWLLAEIIIKQYDVAVAFLKKQTLNSKTHNKAIQKAVESFRLSSEQKNFLKTLRRK